MNLSRVEKSVLRLHIENAALRDAWRSKCCFTVATFCAKHGFKDSRYLRAILRDMVGNGDLYTFKGHGGTNRLKVWFCAQQTDMMAIFEGELK